MFREVTKQILSPREHRERISGACGLGGVEVGVKVGSENITYMEQNGNSTERSPGLPKASDFLLWTIGADPAT